MAGAALALTLTSSQAQVYSQNVVGYINVTIPANQFALIGNQLQFGSDANQTNNDAALLAGVNSDFNGVTNTVLYYWNGGGYNIYYYYLAADADNQFGSDSGNGWYDGGGGFHVVSLSQGAGSFVRNAFPGGQITVTTAGQVVQGTYSLPIVVGLNAVSIVPPISTNIDSAQINWPGTSDFNGATNDVMYIWTGSGYNIAYYYVAGDADNQFGSDSGNGWYDGGGTFRSLDPNYQPKVGQGFFLRSYKAKTWTYSFTVQ